MWYLESGHNWNCMRTWSTKILKWSLFLTCSFGSWSLLQCPCFPPRLCREKFQPTREPFDPGFARFDSKARGFVFVLQWRVSRPWDSLPRHSQPARRSGQGQRREPPPEDHDVLSFEAWFTKILNNHSYYKTQISKCACLISTIDTTRHIWNNVELKVFSCHRRVYSVIRSRSTLNPDSKLYVYIVYQFNF